MSRLSPVCLVRAEWLESHALICTTYICSVLIKIRNCLTALMKKSNITSRWALIYTVHTYEYVLYSYRTVHTVYIMWRCYRELSNEPVSKMYHCRKRKWPTIQVEEHLVAASFLELLEHVVRVLQRVCAKFASFHDVFREFIVPINNLDTLRYMYRYIQYSILFACTRYKCANLRQK